MYHILCIGLPQVKCWCGPDKSSPPHSARWIKCCAGHMAAFRGRHYTWENSRRRHHCRRHCHYLCCHDRLDLCCHHHSNHCHHHRSDLLPFRSCEWGDGATVFIRPERLQGDDVRGIAVGAGQGDLYFLYYHSQDEFYPPKLASLKKHPWFYWCDYQQTHLHNFRSQTPDKLRFVFNSIDPSIFIRMKTRGGCFSLQETSPSTLYPISFRYLVRFYFKKTHQLCTFLVYFWLLCMLSNHPW